MNYSGEGDMNDPDDTLLAAQIFAVALGHILRESEGVCVEVSVDADQYETDKMKFFVYRSDDRIYIDHADDESVENGMMVWMNEATIQ